MINKRNKADAVILGACLLIFVILCLLNSSSYEFPYVPMDEQEHISYAWHLRSYGVLFPRFDDMYLYDFATKNWISTPNYVNHPPFGYHLLNLFSLPLEAGREQRYISVFMYSLGIAVILGTFFYYRTLPLFPFIIVSIIPFFLSVPQFASVFSNDSIAFLGGSLVFCGTLMLGTAHASSKETQHSLMLIFAGLALTLMAKLTAALLVGSYALIMLAFALAANSSILNGLKRPIPLLFLVVSAAAALPYAYFIFEYGSPAPNTLAQLSKLKEGGNLQSIMSLRAFIVTSLLEAPKNAGLNSITIVSYYLYFTGIIASIVYALFAGKSAGPAFLHHRKMAVAALIATLFTMSVHLGFSYQRHVAYGNQVELYPRYYFPLMGVYLFLIATGLEGLLRLCIGQKQKSAT